MNLTTTEHVKRYLTDAVPAAGARLAGDDALLGQLVTWVSENAAGYMDRLIEQASRTEYFDIDYGQRLVMVRAYPIASISSIVNDVTRAYTSGTIDSDDYVADASGPIINFDYSLSAGPRALKVTYTGGLGTTVDAICAAYPDLCQAVTTQVAHEWKRRASLGEDASVIAQGSITPGGPVNWLPMARATLDRYRRPYVR